MQIKITLQPEIYKKVKENSEDYMRTLSAEINFMLKKAYDMDTKSIENNEEPSSSKKIKRDGDLW